MLKIDCNYGKLLPIKNWTKRRRVFTRIHANKVGCTGVNKRRLLFICLHFLLMTPTTLLLINIADNSCHSQILQDRGRREVRERESMWTKIENSAYSQNYCKDDPIELLPAT